MPEGEGYTWEQTLTEVTVEVPVPAGTRGKQVACSITPTALTVGLVGAEPVIEGELFARVVVDDSMWTVVDRKSVVVTLTKSKGQEWWKSVIKGHAEIDTSAIEPENSKLSDLDGETRAMVEKMMFDQRQKAMGKPTSDEMEKQRQIEAFMKAHPEMDFSQAKIG